MSSPSHRVAPEELPREDGRAKPHVLLMTCHFPPSAAPGARRALRFARGLAADGMRVSVLTLDDRFHYLGVDPLARADAEGPFEVFRTTTWDPIARLKARQGRIRRYGVVTQAGAPAPVADRDGASPLVRFASEAFRRVLLPDIEITWLPPALRRAYAVHARDPIDVVLTTLPPRSTLVGAAQLARRTGAKLVVDYRDPWAADRAHNPPRPRWLRAIDARIERRSLQGAALALFTSPSALEFYRREFPGLPRLEVLYNGVDEWMSGAVAMPSPLTWTYAGELYDGRSLAAVVRAMARLRERVDLRLVVVGNEPVAERALARQLGVEERIEYVGRLPLRTTRERTRASHRLVAMIPEAHSLSIPAKVFDYMATRRPILLLAAPDHAAAAVLAGVSQHRVLRPDDVDGVAGLIEEDARALRAGGIAEVDAEAALRFDAREQMKQLARWIREL